VAEGAAVEGAGGVGAATAIEARQRGGRAAAEGRGTAAEGAARQARARARRRPRAGARRRRRGRQQRRRVSERVTESERKDLAVAMYEFFAECP
jgi:glycine/D-amino acid oxidase-like deaminating enzyme